MADDKRCVVSAYLNRDVERPSHERDTVDLGQLLG
jgi:hypothetical protein